MGRGPPPNLIRFNSNYPSNSCNRIVLCRRRLFLSRKRWIMSRNFLSMWPRRISSFNRRVRTSSNNRLLICARWSSMWTPSNQRPSRLSWMKGLNSLSTIVRGRSRWWTSISRRSSSCRHYSTTQGVNFQCQRRPVFSKPAVPIVLPRNNTSQRRLNPLRRTRQCPSTPRPRSALPKNRRSHSHSRDRRQNQVARQRQSLRRIREAASRTPRLPQIPQSRRNEAL